MRSLVSSSAPAASFTKTWHVALPSLYAPQNESVKFLFGEELSGELGGRVAAVQSLSGTGALRLAAELLHKLHGDAKVLLPTPTWPNHAPIFMHGGVCDCEWAASMAAAAAEDLWQRGPRTGPDTRLGL